MSMLLSKPEYEVAYQDLAELLRKHADKMSSEELLAVGANMLGKLIALQDQRTMTKERAMKIVCANIEAGNQHVVGTLANESDGEA